MGTPAILAIRPDDIFSRTLRDSGFEVLNLELIRTEPIAGSFEISEMLAQLDDYDGIFITSSAAAKILAGYLEQAGGPYLGKVYVLGERSITALSKLKLNVVISELANTAAELITSLGEAEFKGKRLLFIRGDRTVGTITEMLAGHAIVDELIVYRTIETRPTDGLVEAIKTRFKRNEIGWLCFFSPSGVTSFIDIFGDVSGTRKKGAAIGETTANAARNVGLSIDFISPRATAKDFAAGLAAFIKNIE